jgi:hypothetical protein
MVQTQNCQFNFATTANKNMSVQELLKFWEKQSSTPEAVKSRPKLTLTCSVKAVTIDEHELYEVELKCLCCKSNFIVRAAHECENEKAVSPPNNGLEWIQSELEEHVNLAF